MFRIGSQIRIKSLTSMFFSEVLVKESDVRTKLIRPLEFIRETSFFNKLSNKFKSLIKSMTVSVTAKELWKGVTSVSNAGKKRGRGRGTDKKGRKDFNQGQKLGVGKADIVWPGLTTPVIQSNTLINIYKRPQSTEPEPVNVVKKHHLYHKLHPLERGWCGRGIQGKSIGPPNPNEECALEDFNCIVVENKIVATVTAILGRKRKFSILVLTGNGKGIIGFGAGKGLETRSALNQAKNNATKNLITIDLIDKYTVNHDFFSQFGKTKLFVFKKEKGYGLKCHRVIQVCCRLLGITDLAANVEGSCNVRHIIKAFLLGLLRQKTFEEIANECNLHLVEYNKNQLDFPNLVASPDNCLTPQEAIEKRINFEEYIMGNRLVYRRPKPVPFYEKLPSWERQLKNSLHLRNQDEVKTEIRAAYGELKSYLADIYPECNLKNGRKKKNADNENS